MKRLTIKDIAKEAGVSVGLVSMVLNGREGVNRNTANRVLDVVKRLNYTPNKSASALRIGHKNTIGVITPDISNHYFSEISRHIENIAYSHGYTVLFGSSDDDPEKIGRLIETFNSDGVKGILLSPCDDCEPEIERALSLGMSIVLMNRDLNGLETVGRVILDNDKAIAMAIDHLLDNGYRHIEVISNEIKISTLRTREQAYLREMKQRGMEDIARITYVKGNDKDDIDAAVRAAYQRGTDALIVPRGYLTLHVSNAIRRVGLNIPEDIALVGFDGGDTYRIMTPVITQMYQNNRETAYDAYTMLCEMMYSNVPGTRIEIEPRIEVGGSTVPDGPLS
ncbi:MAG: LacI family DNA-binding transcriptional regulator [Bacteroidales bacterium]|nr:LacI family DNA-binding transcriptional regulator [Bacteroidales bacterium]